VGDGIQGQGSAPQSQIAQFRSDGITAATGLRIPFFSDDFSRAYGLPPARLVNMLSEATPLREERPYVPLVGLREVRYSRPGLVSVRNQGTGPIRGMFYQEGSFFGGTLIWVSGTNFYADTTLIGTIPGTDRVRFATSASQLIIVAGGIAYLWDGAYFGPLTAHPSFVADGSYLPPVIDVACLAQQFVFAMAGSIRFYFSAPNNAVNISALNFESKEIFPDPIVGLAVWNDALAVFGSQSVQFFSLSADPNAPFTPQLGQGFQRGCASRDAIAYADNALFWVGENRVVYRSAPTPSRISSNSIEDKLRQCTNIAALTAFVVTFEGHELYVLNIPGQGSFAYDISRIGTTISTYGDSFSRGEWDEWQSWQHPTFRGACGLMAKGTAYIGDDTTADIWTMQFGVYTDAGGPMTRQASAFIKIEEGAPRCLNLVLHCVMGVGNPVDPGLNPVAEMRYSDDLGGSFSRWRQAPLNQVGNYGSPRCMWQRLGLLRAPGRLIEVRVTDPVNACFSHLELNASRPAR